MIKIEIKVHSINKWNESIWVLVSFNDASGWAFTEGPKTMRRPELQGTKGTKNKELNKISPIWWLNKAPPTIKYHTWCHFLDTFANTPFNDAFDLVRDPVISSAVVTGPPVECRCPIRWTEGWLTCFQGRGCYDIQWHDNTAEWKARQYVVQALVNQTHLLWTSNWLASLHCALNGQTNWTCKNNEEKQHHTWLGASHLGTNVWAIQSKLFWLCEKQDKYLTIHTHTCTHAHQTHNTNTSPVTFKQTRPRMRA